MDIVLQGPVFQNTIRTAQYYLQLDFVDKVIISTWKPEIDVKLDNVEFVFSDQPFNESPGNMNLQIVSSKNGLDKTTSEIVAKMRGDQCLTHESMTNLHNFFLQNDTNEISYSDGTMPDGPVFVLGMHCCFPYHPQDHIFWGHSKDVIKVCDIPLMDSSIWRVGNNFDAELRDPMYICAHYYKLFNPVVQEHIDNHQDYLVDIAPTRDEAMDAYNEMRDKVFKVFPKVDMWWEKYNMPYPYNGYEIYGEYYSDSIPEKFNCIKVNNGYHVKYS